MIKNILVWICALIITAGMMHWIADFLAVQAVGNTYYVSKNGSNADGLTWESAWNELDQINWNDAVHAGDTVYIDGGQNACATPDSNPYNDFTNSTQTYAVQPGFGCGMKYETVLTPQSSGTAAQPITIALSQESGHNGTVVIFGGRTTPLPYCLQPGYVFQTSGVRAQGIAISGQSYISIDGKKWGGIVIYGHNTYGMTVSGSSSHILVRNLHIYDNGFAYEPNSDGNWSPDNPGVNLGGSDNTFERMIVHDNGQDSFQSSGVSNFTLRQSWLYNGREHPILTGAAYNYCRHTDGLQIFNGGVMSNILLDQNIAGPRLMQGFLLGDVNATVNNVTIKNSLIFGTSNMSAGSNTPTIPPVNWRVENVTSIRAYDPNNTICNDGGGHTDTREQWNNLQVTGTNHIVKNSIFYGGCTMDFPDISGTVPSESSNNCVYGIKNGIAKIDAVITNPLFTNAPGFDFSLRSPSCTGKGSPLTSISALFNAYPDNSSSVWRQTDWTGGSGQTDWANTTRFADQSGINFTSPGQVSLNYTDPNTPSWYNFDWGYRKKISIDHTKVSGTADLIDFPVLITASGDADLQAHTRVDGNDILFTKADGTTKLPHEMEKYIQGTGTLVAWVKIPALSPTADTDIYMYYGNSSSSAQQQSSGVWDNNYVGVWHLGESSGTHFDSTINNNDSNSVAVTQQGTAVGKADGADEFNGTSDQIHINDNSSFNFSNAVTVEAWVKPAGTIDGTKDRQIAGKYQNAYSLSATRTISSTPIFEVYVNGGFRNVKGTANLPTGSWTYTVGTYDSTDRAIKLFVNGLVNQTTNLTGFASYALGMANSTFRIGRFYSSGYFQGTIDEVRVSKIKRSADWIATQYNNQNAPSGFVHITAQASTVSPVYTTAGTLTSSVLDSSNATTWGTVFLSANTPLGTSASVRFRTANDPNMFAEGNFLACPSVPTGENASNFFCVTNGDRYIQYQISLSTNNTLYTPVLYELSLAYNPYVAVPTSSPPMQIATPRTNTFSSPGAPSCSATVPGLTAPFIYRITQKGKSAVLLSFTPADAPIDHYVLEYGIGSNKYIYGADNFGDEKSEQLEVNGLSGGKKYYFRIRGGNKCAVGPWSDEVSFLLGVKTGTVNFTAPLNHKINSTSIPRNNKIIPQNNKLQQKKNSLISELIAVFRSFIQRLRN